MPDQCPGDLPAQSVPGVIGNGDLVQVKVMSSATSKALMSAQVTWGIKAITSFNVTTR